MNKALLYVATAIILGLALTLIPTWLIVRADQYDKHFWGFAQFRGAEEIPPFLYYSEQNNVETVSPREVEVLGISFVVALVVYIAFKRRTPRHDYIWPPIYPY